MSGRRLGSVTPEALVDTRLQLHHAIQPLTSFAQALAEPMDDDQHRNLDWDIGTRGFRSRPAAGAPAMTTVFAVESFELRLEREDVVLASIPARGRSVDELRAALERAVTDALPSRAPEFEPPEFELPDHAVAGGHVSLTPDADALAELARWYTHADRALLRLEERVDVDMDEPRVWPHHFDLATLLHAASGTVGVGLSPGDGGIEHPYWYVRGYPDDGTAHDPAGLDLPALERGRWKFEGWTGAVLDAPDLVGKVSDDARDEAADGVADEVADDFLSTAVTFCLGLLD